MNKIISTRQSLVQDDAQLYMDWILESAIHFMSIPEFNQKINLEILIFIQKMIHMQSIHKLVNHNFFDNFILNLVQFSKN